MGISAFVFQLLQGAALSHWRPGGAPPASLGLGRGLTLVLEGQLVYRILEPAVEEVQLSESVSGVVEPERLHQVAADGPVRFYVEFYR